MAEKIINKNFDEERALYNLKDTEVENCVFAGERDGESSLKEARNVVVKNCSFSLRYPLWHNRDFYLLNSKMDEFARAPIWYAENGVIEKSCIKSIKCLRECKNIKIKDSEINSSEFGWKSENILLENSDIESEYFMFDSSNVKLENINFKGKYSFQYINNLEISNCNLDTKDAFWHSKNVTVKNSVVKGEYLGWFSENLTLIDCKIIGTQPLCYCKNLKLINCTMEGTNLAFEYSEVEADINGYIESVKNVKSGIVSADEIGEVINENSIMETDGKIVIKKQHD